MLGLLAALSPFLIILPLNNAMGSSFVPFLLPAAIGLAGIAVGVKAVADGRLRGGIGQIVTALLGGAVGTALAFTMGVGFDR